MHLCRLGTFSAIKMPRFALCLNAHFMYNFMYNLCTIYVHCTSLHNPCTIGCGMECIPRLGTRLRAACLGNRVVDVGRPVIADLSDCLPFWWRSGQCAFLSPSSTCLLRPTKNVHASYTNKAWCEDKTIRQDRFQCWNETALAMLLDSPILLSPASMVGDSLSRWGE